VSRDGRVVGRISAQVNHAFNDYQKKNWGWFGFLEFPDDQEVLEGLLGAAEGWLRDRGRELPDLRGVGLAGPGAADHGPAGPARGARG